MKKLILILTWSLAATCASAQGAFVGVDFEVLFDNREDAACYLDDSKTWFTARLTPYTGWQWSEKNRLVVGADLFQNMGSGSRRFIDKAQALVYYEFKSDRVKALAGIFHRSELRGRYTGDIMGSTWSFYNNLVQGFAGQYRSADGDSFVELALNWEGAQSRDTREKFRLQSAGEYRFGRGSFYGGYALSVLHFAKRAGNQFMPDGRPEGVVDYIVANPYIGYRNTLGEYAFNASIGLMQTFQNDRRSGEGWKMPARGQLDMRVSRWGLTLSNMLYVGKGQMPFWDLYGSALYACPVFFASNRGAGNLGIYNRTGITYGRSFFDKTLTVSGGFHLHYDGVGVGCQQVVKVSVNLYKSHLHHGKRKTL